jgi:hypothetical protein
MLSSCMKKFTIVKVIVEDGIPLKVLGHFLTVKFQHRVKKEHSKETEHLSYLEIMIKLNTVSCS